MSATISSHAAERLLVFGASGGIGSEICASLIEQEVEVIGVSRSTRASQDRHIRWVVWPDLLDEAGPPETLRGVFTGVIWAHGANATDNIRTMNVSDHQAMYATNVLSILVTLRSLLQAGRLAEDARLLILSSIWQNIGRPNKLSYMVTKSALAGLVRSLSIDLGPEGKLINAILPGPVETPMTRAALSSDQISMIERTTPARRLPAASDVSHLAIHLASKQNKSITGQFFIVDGGFSDAKII